MAESADALDSGSSRGNSVEVQVLLSAPKRRLEIVRFRVFFYAFLRILGCFERKMSRFTPNGKKASGAFRTIFRTLFRSLKNIIHDFGTSPLVAHIRVHIDAVSRADILVAKKITNLIKCGSLCH